MDSAGDTYYDATASAGGALAVGQNSVADGHQGTAIGYATHAGQYSFAGGTQAEADMSSVAIGDYAKANNSGSVAIGSGIRRVANDPASEYKKLIVNTALQLAMRPMWEKTPKIPQPSALMQN